MERNEKIEKIIEWFDENEDTFNDCIEDLDSYNGYLGDDRYYGMDELSELYHDCDPIDLLNRAFFGYDSENWWIDERGEKHYGPFNPNRDYFTFNGYGNFVSADYKDYSDHLDHYAVESMAENRCHIWEIENNPELCELFDNLENDDDEQEAC